MQASPLSAFAYMEHRTCRPPPMPYLLLIGQISVFPMNGNQLLVIKLAAIPLL